MGAVRAAGAEVAKLRIPPTLLNGKVFLLPPIGGEPAGAGGGEDGLAKAFEQDGNLRQPLLARVHFANQRLQLRHNPPLLGERSKRDFEFFNEARRNAGLPGSSGEVFLRGTRTLS